SQLHGVLTGIRDIGASVLSLQLVEAGLGDSALVPGPVLDRVLHTERLRLREATPEDAVATWTYRCLGAGTEWLTGAPSTCEAYRTLLTGGGWVWTWVVVELRCLGGQAGCVVGDFVLRRDEAWSQAEVVERAGGAQVEFGWVLAPAHTGAGYAT